MFALTKVVRLKKFELHCLTGVGYFLENNAIKELQFWSERAGEGNGLAAVLEESLEKPHRPLWLREAALEARGMEQSRGIFSALGLRALA